MQFRSFRPRLPIGGVARNMVLVGGGTALGQGALVVASPILARLYDPQAFGLLSIYAAVLAVLVAVASLRFDFAIPIAVSSDEAVHLFLLSVILGLGASVALGIVLVLWGEQLAVAAGAAAFTNYLWILPIGLFVLAAAQALSAWAIYHRSFPELGRWRTVQGLMQAVSQVVLGVLHAGPAGLIGGDVVGRLFGMQRVLRSLLGALSATTVSTGGLLRYAKERWGFARVMTTASVLNALTTQLPFLLIPSAFGLGSSGQYFLAYRMLVLPSSLVSAAFNQVFFGEASFRRDDPKRFHDLTRDAALSLLVFAIPTYAIVAVAGSQLIEIVFGAQWSEAGLFAQIIAPSLILWSVTHPMSSLLLIGRRERESLAFTATELVSKATALGIGIALHSLTIGVVLLAGVSILLSVGSLWQFLRVAGVRVTELIRPGGRIIAFTVPSLVLVGAVVNVAPGLTLPTAAVAWLVAFGLAAWRTEGLRAFVSESHD